MNGAAGRMQRIAGAPLRDRSMGVVDLRVLLEFPTLQHPMDVLIELRSWRSSRGVRMLRSIVTAAHVAGERLRGLVLRAVLAAPLLAGCSDSTAPPPRPDPDAARVVASDIPRFWTAFDRMQGPGDTLPLRRDYLDPGTIGLKDFTSARWKNARTLAAMVWPRRAYYASIRENTLRVAELEPEIHAAYRALQDMYEDAVFPDVYFAIGGMSTGGTTSEHGILIGTELFARAEDSPVASLTPWQQSVIRSLDVLPTIVAHELIHFQQRVGTDRSLLARSILEGSADFLAKLLTGRTINEQTEAYGLVNESELWAEFEPAMHGGDISRWLYNGGSVTGPGERPADLGYFIGARITEAYYARQADKRRAVREILAIRDFAAFLEGSGYGERFR
jgi:hypothetical protein